MDALRPLWDAERPGLHSHAERGNDHPPRDQRSTGKLVVDLISDNATIEFTS